MVAPGAWCCRGLVFPLLSYVLLWIGHRLLSSQRSEPFVAALGHVQPRQAVVWVHAPTSQPHAFQIQCLGDENAPSTDWLPLEPLGIAHRLEQLTPGTRYECSVTVRGLSKDHQSEAAPPHAWRGAVRITTPPEHPREVSFVFSSCWLPLPWVELSLLDWIHAQLRPSFFLHLGDFIYSDFVRIGFDQAFAQVWHDAALQRFAAHTPIYAMMDDHEVANDWGVYEGQNASAPLFRAAAASWDRWMRPRNPGGSFPDVPTHRYSSIIAMAILLLVLMLLVAPLVSMSGTLRSRTAWPTCLWSTRAVRARPPVTARRRC